MNIEGSPSTSSSATPSVEASPTSPEPTSPATPSSPSLPSNLLTTPLPPSPASSSPSSVSPKLIRDLIVSYLIHNCYEQTAIALLSVDGDVVTRQKLTEFTAKSQPHEKPLIVLDDHKLTMRRKIITNINNGDIQPALSLANGLLQSHSNPTSLPDSFPETYVRALCQHFVELLRVNENFSALAFARDTISPFGKQHHEALVLLQRYLPLLAYSQPELSPIFDLVDLDRRATLAEELNSCTVAWLKGDTGLLCTMPLLERVIRQLILVKRKLNNDQWSLNDVLDEDVKME